MDITTIPLPTPQEAYRRYNELAKLPPEADDEKVLTGAEARDLARDLAAALSLIKQLELEKRGEATLMPWVRWHPDNEWLGLPPDPSPLEQLAARERSAEPA